MLRTFMTFSPKTARSGWLRRMLVVCTAALCLALIFYFLSRASSGPPHRLQGPNIKTGEDRHADFLTSSEPHRPALHITSVVLHGDIVEIQGSTDPGAVVMINGETASTIFGGNQFRHFLGPLPPGTTIVTVTSQDERGGVNTQQIATTIEQEVR